MVVLFTIGFYVGGMRMRRYGFLVVVLLIFGCEVQDAPPEPKSAKVEMVERSYGANSVLRQYEAKLEAEKIQPPPPPPPKKETVSSLMEKLKKAALKDPNRVRSYWDETVSITPRPPKPPASMRARDWIKWAQQMKDWSQRNEETFRKWVKPLIAEVLPEKKPPKKGKAPMSLFLDEAAKIMRSARSVDVFKAVLQKYEKEIEETYKDDVKSFPELEGVAKPWMDAFERFKKAVEGGDLDTAKRAVTDMMLSWRNWNLKRRMLRGE